MLREPEGVGTGFSGPAAPPTGLATPRTLEDTITGKGGAHGGDNTLLHGSAKRIAVIRCHPRQLQLSLQLNRSAVSAVSAKFGELPRGRKNRWGPDSFCYRSAHERPRAGRRRAGSCGREGHCVLAGLYDNGHGYGGGGRSWYGVDAGAGHWFNTPTAGECAPGLLTQPHR